MFKIQSLEAMQAEQELYVFDSFDNTAAFELGKVLIERALDYAHIKPMAFRIVFDDLAVFQYHMQGTSLFNKGWMDRKQHTVTRTHAPSLRALIEKELFGIKEKWQTMDDYYAFVGGAFPINIKNEYRGMVIVSGLPHLLDHEMLVKSLAQFLGKKEIHIPVFN